MEDTPIGKAKKKRGKRAKERPNTKFVGVDFDRALADAIESVQGSEGRSYGGSGSLAGKVKYICRQFLAEHGVVVPMPQIRKLGRPPMKKKATPPAEETRTPS